MSRPGFTEVAEGIETQEHKSCLIDMVCWYGYCHLYPCPQNSDKNELVLKK
jgi:hypothetical protein